MVECPLLEKPVSPYADDLARFALVAVDDYGDCRRKQRELSDWIKRGKP